MHKTFQCTKCGVCCTRLDLSELYSFLNRGDGVCCYFDENSRLCTIYSERPELCNVELMYEKEFYKFFSKEEYLLENYKACELLKKGG